MHTYYDAHAFFRSVGFRCFLGERSYETDDSRREVPYKFFTRSVHILTMTTMAVHINHVVISRAEDF